jgi:hypothetical protein
MALISSLVVVLALFFIYRTWAKWVLDPVGLFVGMFTLSYGLRAIIIGFGVDGEYPDYLFQFGSPAVTANLYLLVFLFFVAVGLIAGSQGNLNLRFLFPSSSHPLDTRKSFRISTVLTGIWFVVTLGLLARYGGISGLVRASKVDKNLAGLFFLFVFPSAGSVSALVTAFSILKTRAHRLERGQRRILVVSFLYAVFNGVGVYAWGARALLVVIVAQSVVGYFTFRPASSRLLSQGIRPRFVLGLFLAFGVGMCLVFGLRVYRDQNLSGAVSGNIAGQSIVRQLSVATNSVYYDAYLLAVRDWPSRHRYRGGTDIFNGASGVIPRAIWAGKPETVSPGAWFRRVYEPKNVNGWPMGSVGVWYLNFGRVGLVIGGLITGFVVAAAARSFPDTRTNPLAFVMAISIGFWVIGDGVDGQFVTKWAQWVLPMIFLIPLMRQPRRAPLPVAARN